MIKKTKEFDKFTFRNDNRDGIDMTHLKRIVESIKRCNLLEFKPININEKWEVLDGQHRLLAAQELGLDIYYTVTKDITPIDMIALNLCKNWTINDYLNYFVKNGHKEYIKLEKFKNENQISLVVALKIIFGVRGENYINFRNGNFVFGDLIDSSILEKCKETIAYIKKMNTYCNYTSSTRFWHALIKLIQHANYDHKKWMKNLSMHISKLGSKSTNAEYENMLINIYNWRNNDKIESF